MLNVKNTILESLLSVVAPHLCSGCGRVGGTFCNNCKYDIIDEPYADCILCEKASPSGVCAEHKVAFNQAWVVGYRSGGLQRLIGGYKFRHMKAASVDLADLLNMTLPQLPVGTIIVPIPTTPAHIRERGYDHMVLIAMQLGRLRHLPVQQLLQRDNMLIQHHVGRKDRLKQAKTAFRVEGVIDADAIYLILDDVVTTGATISQAAYLLHRAGATTTWVAVTSRQPLD
jgi:ComF family protein